MQVFNGIYLLVPNDPTEQIAGTPVLWVMVSGIQTKKSISVQNFHCFYRTPVYLYTSKNLYVLF